MLTSLHVSLAASHISHAPFEACSVSEANHPSFTFTSVIAVIGWFHSVPED